MPPRVHRSAPITSLALRFRPLHHGERRAQADSREPPSASTGTPPRQEDVTTKSNVFDHHRRKRHQASTHRHDRHDGEDHFVADAISVVEFSDDLTLRPNRSDRPAMDTVDVSGTTRWNDQAGYRFQLRATDAGEPGRGARHFRADYPGPSGRGGRAGVGPLRAGNIQWRKMPGTNC